VPIELRNPHSVLAALKQRPQAVLSLQVARTKLEPAWRDVLALADSLGIRASTIVDSSGAARKQTGQRQSAAIAIVLEKPMTPIDVAWEILATQKTSLWLALDQIQDPHNLGAILRSASFFDVRAVFLTRDRAAPLTPTVYDVSAGGVEYLPIVEVPNLARLFEQAKERGLWILGTSEHAETDLSSIALDRQWMLVVGNEQHGLRRLTLDLCDQVARIPSRGGVTSLNASAATAVALAQLSRAAT
jgi:23S rRNA (guanosine2251-2'-O)-methyltransferase